MQTVDIVTRTHSDVNGLVDHPEFDDLRAHGR